MSEINRLEEEKPIIKTISELAIIHNGIDYKNNPKGDEIPIYGTGGIIGYTSVALNEGPAVLTGRKGTINRPFYIEGKFWNVDTIFCLKPLSSVNAKWLYYNILYSDMNKLNEATGVPSITSKALYKLKINYINYSKQCHIAQILTTCDKVIEQTEAAIAKYKAIKQGMLHDLFTRGLDENGKLRPAPSEAPDLYKESELGLIPKDWEVHTLGKCCKTPCSYGINAPAVNYNSRLPLYLRITDITENGSYNKNDRKCVDAPTAHQYVLNEGDIVFARTGATVGKTYLYNSQDGILIYAGFLIKFSPNKNILDSYLLKSYTETDLYWNWVNTYSQRSGQPGINGNEYSSLLLPCPKIEEQNKIATIFASMDQKIQGEEILLYKQKLVKKGLMKLLLNNN